MARRTRRKVRKTMSKRIKTLLVTFVVLFCIFMSSAAPAFAYVDPEWEEGKGPDEAEYPTDTTVVIAEPTTTPLEQAFSTPGNGDLGDVITSGKKDFFTIHTKNNSTFYLVIDHAGNVDNVYMLSLIDENDLVEFITETEKQPEKQQHVVVLPEATPQPQSDQVVIPEPKAESNSNMMSLILFAVIGGGAAFFYFKVYKPRKDAEQSISEGLETGGDGLDTVNEDNENKQ